MLAIKSLFYLVLTPAMLGQYMPSWLMSITVSKLSIAMPLKMLIWGKDWSLAYVKMRSAIQSNPGPDP
jgi:hypothetical protein